MIAVLAKMCLSSSFFVAWCSENICEHDSQPRVSGKQKIQIALTYFRRPTKFVLSIENEAMDFLCLRTKRYRGNQKDWHSTSISVIGGTLQQFWSTYFSLNWQFFESYQMTSTDCITLSCPGRRMKALCSGLWHLVYLVTYTLTWSDEPATCGFLEGLYWNKSYWNKSYFHFGPIWYGEVSNSHAALGHALALSAENTVFELRTFRMRQHCERMLPLKEMIFLSHSYSNLWFGVTRTYSALTKSSRCQH